MKIATRTAGNYRRGMGAFVLLATLLGQIAGGCVWPCRFHAEGTPAQYRVAAAGIVKGNMTVRVPVYRGLQVVRIQSGQLVLTFDGYSQPQRADGHMYIVNAMPVAHDEMTLPVIALESFAQDGIVLRITDPDGIMLLPLRFLVETEFIIEVREIYIP